MKTTIYLSPKLMRIFKKASLVECSKLGDNEGVIISLDSTLDAVLEGKQQIASSKAAVKLSIDSESFKNFYKGLEHSKIENKDENELKVETVFEEKE